MKLWILTLLFLPWAIFAVESKITIQAKPADQITFSKEIPLKINAENEELLLQIHEQQMHASYQNYLAHQFPWKVIWVLGAIIIGYGIWKAWHEMYRRTHTIEKTAQERALQQLKSIKKLNLPTKGQYDTYYVLVTGIVRQYFAEKYSIPAPKQTSYEIIDSERKRNLFDEEMQRRIEQFFLKSDQVKFAAFQGDLVTSEETYKEALQIILTQRRTQDTEAQRSKEA